MNHYQILEVSTDASQEEIKKSYRKLVKVHHPDTGGDDNQFKKLSDAYETLSDPEKRKLYDIKIGVRRDAMDAWQSYFNQAFGGGAGFSDIFDKTYSTSAKGPDVKIRINLTMQDVYYGTTRYIDTGENKFNVKIPRGIKNGAKLRIRDKGRAHPYNSTAPRGDVILIMQWMVDPELIVNGDDIWIDLTVPFYDMILGTNIEVNTKVNTTLVEIPKNSYEGRVIAIEGGGMPIYNTNSYGKLMIKLISKPIKLTEKQLELIEKIKELSGE